MAGIRHRAQPQPRSLDEVLATHVNRLIHAQNPPSRNVDDLCRWLAGARALFAADDVSLAIHDPRAPLAGPARPWFAQGTPSGLESALRDPAEGHLPLRWMRREGSATSITGGTNPSRARDLQPAYLRALAAAGRSKMLLGHLGGGESLGRVEWYRSADAPDFTEDDEVRLRMLMPSMAEVLRSQVGRADSQAGETALINAAGRILWATDGFRFRWSTASGVPLLNRQLPIGDLLNDGPLGRRVARLILGLADPNAIVSRDRQGTAEWTVLPGGPYGCVGQVLALDLHRARPAVVPMAPTVSAQETSNVTP